MVKAFVFDIDGTLVDTRELHISAWQKAFAEFGLDIGVSEIQGQLGRRAVEIAKILVPGDRAELRRDILQAKWRAFRSLYSDVKAFPKTKELFAYLHGRGIVIALATSAIREEAQFNVEVLSVGQYLQAMVTAEDVEHSKPHPEIFLKAAARIGIAPGEAIAVGDSMHDMESASAAGMTAVGLLAGGNTDTDLRSGGAVRVYDDIADLYGHIQDLL